MKLARYLEREALTYSEFARRIGAANAQTVIRYARGQQNPHARIMRRIFEETAGEVTANDFFDLEPSSLGAGRG